MAPIPKIPTSTRRPHWVVIGFETDFRKSPLKVHTRTVHDKDFAVCTTRNGGVYIADDVCPHRGASLSIGSVTNDCIRCSYHGMLVGTETTPERMYNSANTHGIVWMDYASKIITQNYLPPASPPEFSDKSFHTFEYIKALEVNPVTMTENILDWNHLEHVHMFSLVKGVLPIVSIDESGPHGKARYTYILTGKNLPFSEICVETEYWIPFTTSLRFKFRDKTTGKVSTAFHLWFSLTPTRDGKVTFHIRVSRTLFKRLPFITDAIFKIIDEVPLMEDAFVVGKVNAAAWSSNTLIPADDFIAEYRKAMTKNYPDVLSWYVS
jgi:nitrite reductase/ring-hydroxylating ferredoxin subunit